MTDSDVVPVRAVSNAERSGASPPDPSEVASSDADASLRPESWVAEDGLEERIWDAIDDHVNHGHVGLEINRREAARAVMAVVQPVIDGLRAENERQRLKVIDSHENETRVLLLRDETRAENAELRRKYNIPRTMPERLNRLGVPAYNDSKGQSRIARRGAGSVAARIERLQERSRPADPLQESYTSGPLEFFPSPVGAPPRNPATNRP